MCEVHPGMDVFHLPAVDVIEEVPGFFFREVFENPKGDEAFDIRSDAPNVVFQLKDTVADIGSGDRVEHVWIAEALEDFTAIRLVADDNDALHVASSCALMVSTSHAMQMAREAWRKTTALLPSMRTSHICASPSNSMVLARFTCNSPKSCKGRLSVQRHCMVPSGRMLMTAEFIGHRLSDGTERRNGTYDCSLSTSDFL